MKRSFWLLILAIGLLALVERAQAQLDYTAIEATAPTPAAEVPLSSTFYSAKNPFLPPMPLNLNQFSAWPIENGWLLDDLNSPDADLMSNSRFHPLDGEIPEGASYNLPTYTTNDLWLEIVTLTNGITGWTAGLTIHTPWNDTNLTHDLFYATDLNPPVDWRFLMRCPSTNVMAVQLCEPQGYFKLGQTNGALTVSTNWTPQQLAQMLVPSWVSVTNVTYTGSDVARGTFAGGNGCGLPLDSGVILSTGEITNAIGPNDDTGEIASGFGYGPSCLGLDGDSDLDGLVGGGPTKDAAVLEFDIFVTNSFVLRYKYVYGSEEYPEFVGQYNDPFAIFVSTNRVGTNWINSMANDYALVPGTTNTPIGVNTINGGCLNDIGGGYDVPTNPQFYVDNHDPFWTAATNATPAPEFNIQYDGMTILLEAKIRITAGVTNHVKIAIADYSDEQYDSAVFIFQAPEPCK